MLQNHPKNKACVTVCFSPLFLFTKAVTCFCVTQPVIPTEIEPQVGLRSCGYLLKFSEGKKKASKKVDTSIKCLADSRRLSWGGKGTPWIGPARVPMTNTGADDGLRKKCNRSFEPGIGHVPVSKSGISLPSHGIRWSKQYH
ncbi:hypothetical protein QBC40DRAFT_284755 [Triangularia verruculosa]|uniref:Secreted protein n=1 Tax=Triangularia verruculosa TaxID=2587418 RepID=A0AAN6XED0_9PEZI|nr:hypothetical protein QBC40DRAFT_284755 [Triangularia verruculosa]